MREFVRQTLRRFGYDLHRYQPVSSPDAQLEHVLAAFGIDLVLDIGANIGQYGQALRQRGYRGRIVSFEPLAEAHRQLVANAATDRLWAAAPRGAIGDHDGTIEINVAGNSASSSLLDMLDSHRGAYPAADYVGTEKVPIARLDTAAAPWLTTPSRLYLKIDTQGYEAQVIAGGSATLAAAAAVQIEVSMLPLYAGQPDLDTVFATMATHRLVPWALWPGFAHPRTGRILQIEAVFARPEQAL